MSSAIRSVVASCALIVLASSAPASAQTLVPATPQKPELQSGEAAPESPDYPVQLGQLEHALVRLPLAAALACILALRPRRPGTPMRQMPVIQTQIILAVVGALVMIVVGSSLARAFGIVGAAGLVRYRAKIDDPKDAGVMLSTLAVGLAAGVGLWMISVFATAFILAVLWLVESIEPRATQLFALKVKAKDPAKLKPKVEELLARHRARFELRSASKEELEFEVRWPIDRKTDRVSEAILALQPGAETAVEWDEKKDKKR